MKKIVAAIVIFVSVGAALSAQINLSAGVGGVFGFGFQAVSVASGVTKSNYRTSTTGGGGFVFVDATYAEVDIGVKFNSYNIPNNSTNASVAQMTFGAFGKFPIDLGFITVFPMAGIQYDLGLRYKIGSDPALALGTGDNRNLASRFWIKAGAGGDIDITRQIYIRPSLLYGLGIKTRQEDNWTNTTAVERIVPMGLDIRIAAGYRF